MSEHKVRAVIRVVVCECGWQARSDQVTSLDIAFRYHQKTTEMLAKRGKRQVVPR